MLRRARFLLCSSTIHGGSKIFHTNAPTSPLPVVTSVNSDFILNSSGSGTTAAADKRQELRQHERVMSAIDLDKVIACSPGCKCNSCSASSSSSPSSSQGLFAPSPIRLRPPQPPIGPKGGLTSVMSVNTLLEYNKKWAADVTDKNPTYFKQLARQQTPQFLWIGCSDSRVPANQIVGLPPGEVFVHRNVANVVCSSDLNMLSVLQFAVEHLKVKHVIVCGHYNCGGVRASLDGLRLGLVDNWLRHVRDIHSRHRVKLAQIESADTRLHTMCELNVLAQLRNLSKTTVVKDAWKGGNPVELHGWVYGLSDGIIKPLVTLSRGSCNRVPSERAQEVLDLAIAGEHKKRV